MPRAVDNPREPGVAAPHRRRCHKPGRPGNVVTAQMGPAEMLASHAGRAARRPGVYGVFKCLASTFPPCRGSMCMCTSSPTAMAGCPSTTSCWPRRPSTSRPTTTGRRRWSRSRTTTGERQFAAVVFTVDATTATGHPGLSSEEMADRAAEHADVLIPFGSVDPLAGEEAVRRARRLITDHGVRGFKFHPSLQAFSPGRQELLPALLGHRGSRAARGLPHRPDRHRGRPARRTRDQAAAVQPDAARRRGRRLPRHAGHPGPPVGALAGRGDLHRHPQGQRVHRPVRLVAQVLPAPAGPRGQLAAAGQGAVRHRLPAADPGALAARLRAARGQARGHGPRSSSTTRPACSGWR